MDCGIPRSACRPPDAGRQQFEWATWSYRGALARATERLHETNNFPEFTGRVCPAPCEGAYLGVIDPPVTIKNIECTIERGL